MWVFEAGRLNIDRPVKAEIQVWHKYKLIITDILEAAHWPPGLKNVMLLNGQHDQRWNICTWNKLSNNLKVTI